MVFFAAEALGILMRWMHIVSAVLLVGGVAFAGMVAAPVLGGQAALLDRLGTRFRPLAYAAIAGLVVSGTYNYLIHPGHTRVYHIWFGVKVLLALHVFASVVLATRPAAQDVKAGAARLRRMTGAIVSGLIVILIAAYLRRIY
jgi:putative copper export protein